MYKNSFVHHLTKLLVDIMFYGGIVCCVLVPFLVKWSSGYFGYEKSVVLPFTIILLGSGIAAVYIMYNLKSMFKTLLGGNPFVWSNVSCFRKLAVASFAIALLYIVKCLFCRPLLPDTERCIQTSRPLQRRKRLHRVRK
jgi:hypothetical protein